MTQDRDPADRVTDEMLKRPLRMLTPAERAIIRRALQDNKLEGVFKGRDDET